jgi:tRNA uridine 5-carboxymethylaminomethyl modification enzyme
MFTSRAEYRLQLREDNADARLTEAGRKLGLVDDARWDAFSRKHDAVSRETERLKITWVSPQKVPQADAVALLGKPMEHEYTLMDLLRRPGVAYLDLMALKDGAFANSALSDASAQGDAELLRLAIVEQVEIAAKYSGYIDRQREEVGRASHYENLRLPPELDYLQVTALSFEARQRLSQHRPETLGQASRLSGITPATISLLLIHLKKGKFKGFARLGTVADEGVELEVAADVADAVGSLTPGVEAL